MNHYNDKVVQMFCQNYVKVITFCLITLSQTLLSQIVLQGVVTDNGKEPVHNAQVTITDQPDVGRTFSNYTRWINLIRHDTDR